MKRPFNGVCPYCGGQMVAGFHSSSYVIGVVSGVLTMVTSALLWLLR